MVNSQCHLGVPHEFDMTEFTPEVLVIELLKQGPHVPHIAFIQGLSLLQLDFLQRKISLRDSLFFICMSCSSGKEVVDIITVKGTPNNTGILVIKYVTRDTHLSYFTAISICLNLFPLSQRS